MVKPRKVFLIFYPNNTERILKRVFPGRLEFLVWVFKKIFLTRDLKGGDAIKD